MSVGPAGSTYPVTSTISAGGAAATINTAIAAVNAAKGGMVWLLGGVGVIYYTETTIHLKEKVGIFCDGCTPKAMNGAAFSPIYGNLSTESLTQLEYYGLTLNANGANSGYAATAFVPTTGHPYTVSSSGLFTWTGTLNTGSGTLVIAASAAVTSMVINGVTMSTTGPWYLTPTDTFTVTFSAGQTFTYTNLIDGWWTFNSLGNHMFGWGLWAGGVSATQYLAGCAFTLDVGSVQQSSSNWIDIEGSSPTASQVWAAGMRLNGNSTYPTANQRIMQFDVSGCQFRGYDVALSSDTINGFWLRVPKSGSLTPYVGMWIGSASSSGTAGKSDRQYFHAVYEDQITTSDYGVVLGYYNAATPSTTVGVYPSFRVLNFYGPTSLAAAVLDLRSTAVMDWEMDIVTASLRYRAGVCGQPAGAAARQGLHNQVAVPATTVGTAIVPYKVTYYIKTVGGATVANLTDPGGTTVNVFASFIVGGTIVVPAGATLAITWTVTTPTWTSYIGE